MQFPNMDIQGQFALVAGTGSGLGKAIAIGLAHWGAQVAIIESHPTVTCL